MASNPPPLVQFIRYARARAIGTRVQYATVLHGGPVRVYPTHVARVLFLGGIRLMAIGIIGEYLARQRPLPDADEPPAAAS